MAKVIVKPLARTETPDGPRYATEVDGAIVHGEKPMTPEARDAISAVVAAARRKLRGGHG